MTATLRRWPARITVGAAGFGVVALLALPAAAGVRGPQPSAQTAAVPPAPASVPAGSAKSPKPAPPTNDSFVDRLRNFVRKLWSRGA